MGRRSAYPSFFERNLAARHRTINRIHPNLSGITARGVVQLNLPHQDTVITVKLSLVNHKISPALKSLINSLTT